MNLVDLICASSWVPGWLRYRFQEKRLRPLLVRALDDMDLALKLARARLPLCVTHYSRSRLRYYLTDVPNLRSRLIEGAGRQSLAKRGRKRFDTVLQTLGTTLKTIREVCSHDVAHEQELVALRADRNRLAREAAETLVGTAQREFRRFDDQARQRFLAVERCRDLLEVNRCLKDLRKPVSEMDRLLEKAKRVEQDLPALTVSFEAFDRRTIAGDPRSDELYVETAQIFASLREGLGRGEIERSLVLLNKATCNLETLAAQADHVRRDAAVEVELWRRVAVLCPRVSEAFAADLANTPLEPSGDSLANWAVLRRRIENLVDRSARETRSANAKALHDDALRYQWRDPCEQKLLAFADHSYRLWQSAISR